MTLPEPPAATDLPAAPNGAEPIEPSEPARASRLGPILLVAAILIAVVAVIGTRITLPYVIFSPGDATPVDDYVHIKGVKTYGHDGSVLLLTVRVSNGRPNLWRYLQASFDDDSKVIGEEQYLGTTPRKKVDREDVQRMVDSEVAAKQAALTRLGYPVTVRGTGALVSTVVPDSPAAHGGLRVGDVITAIDGAPVSVRDQVGQIVQAKPAGTTFAVTVRRDGKERVVSVTSGTAPDGEIKGKPYLGIGALTADLRVAFPFDVRIDAGDVSGPSGGLAFALTIIDDLTPGDLTGGKKVAVTGEIDGAGNVGEVGGVPQKAVAARDEGARLMIVPKAEVADARSRAGSMKVVGVGTLDDALRVLRANGGAAVPARPTA